jgi:hypothetical protein
MARVQKTTTELKDIILERSGVKVSILPHTSLRWIAIPFASTPHTPEDHRELNRLVTGLRAEYDLKSEGFGQRSAPGISTEKSNFR